MTMNVQRIRKQYKWFIAGLIALAVIAYGSGCAYMWVNQKYYIFMPQREIPQTPADHNLAFEDLYLPVSSTNKGAIERMHCWWIPNDPLSGRYLIYLHGSAFNNGYGPAECTLSPAAD